MPERYQKMFISAREFVESWDKEIYELKNLDFFIYLMINHLGNQLDKRYFIRERRNSVLKLSFDHIATLCFNIGDSFEYFLEGEKEGDHPFQELMELDKSLDHENRKDYLMTCRLETLRAFLNDDRFDEQAFRCDLMEQVVLDTLLQFYYEELGKEFTEEDIEIVELADFIEEVMVEFIRSDGRNLLQQSGDLAIDYFEELLGSEDEYRQDPRWNDDDVISRESPEWESTLPHFEDLSHAVRRFIEDCQRKSATKTDCVSPHIKYFLEYLTEDCGISNIFDLREDHFKEFMAVWLVRKFSQQKEPSFQNIFQSLARFVTWLNQSYKMDFKRSFLGYYDKVKVEVPRVIRILNKYLEDYNLYEAILLRDLQGVNQICGFFEVQRCGPSSSRSVDLVNCQFFDEIPGVKLDTPVFSKFKPGDILQCTLVQKEQDWEVLEIDYVYPKAAEPFLS